MSWYLGLRAVTGVWPLTGRTEELRFIVDCVTTPAVGGVVVSAPAGIGKSRLAREAVESLAGSRHVVRWAVGTSSAASIPLGAFTSWATEAHDRMQLVRGVVAGLTSADRGRAVVIGVDDAHLLDELSVFVLHQIVQRRAAKVVLVVRSGEHLPPGLVEVSLVGDFERLDLQPLSRDDTARAAAAALGGDLHADAGRRLWRLTGGNVLYLRNIVEHEVSHGRLAKVGARWQWMGQPVVPPSLVDLIETRMGTLSPAVGDVVDLLAVGEPIELASLQRMVAPAAIEEAEERGLIVLEDVDGRVVARVAHPLYGEVRRSRAATTRLRRLRGLVVDELATCRERDEVRVVIRRATLTMDSDLPVDPELFTRAAEAAIYLSDLALADRFAEAAIRSGGGREANFIRAHALSWLSRGNEADAVLRGIPQTAADVDLSARIAFLRAINRLFALADPPGAIDVVEDLAHTAGPVTPGCVQAFRVVHAAAAGRPREALAAARDLDVERLPALVGAVTAWGLTVAEGDAGEVGRAIAASSRGYALTSTAFDAGQMKFVVADAHVGVLIQAGRIPDAEAVAAEICADAADRPGAAPLMAAAIAGRCALAAGRVAKAVTSLGPVVDALASVGDANGWAYRYQLPLTAALAMNGDGDAAGALRRLDEWRHPGWACLAHEHSIARAWVSAQEGAVSEAVRILLDAAGSAREAERVAPELACLQLAAQFGDRTGGDRLVELAAAVEGPRAPAAARFAAGLRTGSGSDLMAASERFASLGDVVAAADAAAHAAQAHRRHGLRGSAFAAAATASGLAGDCDSLSTPAMRFVEDRVPLTAREREIATLIGEGLSSRAVADRLTLSVRTIEGHIYRAMNKTGTTTREELAALLSRRPGSGRERRAE